MSVKRYTYLLILFVGVITAVLAGFNYVVDPYLLFGSPRFVGFNDKKPAAANRSQLYKPYEVAAVRPRTLLVGNSRPEMGLDPESACWPRDSGTVYSLTFPGLSTYGQVRALFHGVATGEVKQVLLAVDFTDFLYEREPHNEVLWPEEHSAFTERLLVGSNLEPNDRRWLRSLQDAATVLFSLDALTDSVYTLISQSPASTDRTDLGFNPARDNAAVVRHEGAWVLFRQKLDELTEHFKRKGMSLYDTHSGSLEFEAVRRAAELAEQRDIPLVLFINPYHYSFLEIIRESGYWKAFESFKRSLAELADRYSNVRLWDFALYSSFTVTAIPERDQPALSNNDWFWEPAHYKAELGDRMLAQIYGTSCAAAPTDLGSVGVNLDRVDIDTHLYRQRAARETLLQSRAK